MTKRLMLLGIRVGLIVLACELYLVHLAFEPVTIKPTLQTDYGNYGTTEEGVIADIRPTSPVVSQVWSKRGSVAVVSIDGRANEYAPWVTVVQAVNPNYIGELFYLPMCFEYRAVVSSVASGELHAAFLESKP